MLKEHFSTGNYVWQNKYDARTSIEIDFFCGTNARDSRSFTVLSELQP